MQGLVCSAVECGAAQLWVICVHIKSTCKPIHHIPVSWMVACDGCMIQQSTYIAVVAGVHVCSQSVCVCARICLLVMLSVCVAL